MGNKVITILDELTNLTKDEDLFYLEIPLGKSGLWVNDAQVPSRFNSVDAAEFDIYYRGKDKQKTIDNTKYLKDTIENLNVCMLDGLEFKLEILYTWDYLEKDSEGYFVFGNRLRLTL